MLLMISCCWFQSCGSEVQRNGGYKDSLFFVILLNAVLNYDSKYATTVYFIVSRGPGIISAKEIAHPITFITRKKESVVCLIPLSALDMWGCLQQADSSAMFQHVARER